MKIFNREVLEKNITNSTILEALLLNVLYLTSKVSINSYTNA